ncbi:MAG: hypothetical protein RLZZ546_2255 [Bacteroidota bacterium]|jgi:glycosyltransferase involved in cell wall biosynthesis
MIESLNKKYNTADIDYDFSILIPTWNNLNYLKLCILSLQKNSATKIQIIVFINEGVDGTLEWIKTQKNIDFIYSENNIGICYGLNMCRSLVKSNYIIYLNDDMYVLPDWDARLSQEIINLDSKLFMLSSTMIEPYDTKNPCVVVKNYGDSIDNFNENLLLKEYSTFFKNDWSGSTWPPNVVHVDLWDLVGGLSIEYSPGMYSDPDFAKKLYESGVRVFKGVGSSMVYHFGSKSTKRTKMNKGSDMFLKKWGITSNFFTREILNRGEIYKKLPDTRNTTFLERMLNMLKLIKLLFFK